MKEMLFDFFYRVGWFYLTIGVLHYIYTTG